MRVKNESFHDILKKKSDHYAYRVYHLTKKFPREEMYGVTSQLRRAALSVVLNYIEGYARKGDKEYRYFLKIAYGSLKESKYLIFFSYREKYLAKKDYQLLIDLAEELGAMLWTTIKGVSKK